VAMKTIQIQLAFTLSDEAVNTIAEILGPAFKSTTAQPASDFDEKREARLKASQNALFGGQKPPENQGLLIDSRQAAKLLTVSERTLWKMQNSGEMPAPIRIGRAVRWSLEALKLWIEAGCPKQSQ
jgi:excisionase family DNA binding protein